MFVVSIKNILNLSYSLFFKTSSIGLISSVSLELVFKMVLYGIFDPENLSSTVSSSGVNSSLSTFKDRIFESK